jgi:tetratricopeptide (TPR) repeat protein
MGARADTALDESLARNLAVREGAKAIVTGDVSRLGSGYVLTARIVTADSGATLAPVRVTADDDAHLIAAVNHLSADLRERIGESLRTIRATEPLDQVTTASLPALRLYTEGARAFDAGRFGVARGLLLRATQTDTAFAMAWRKLAAVYFNIGSSRALQVEAATQAFNHRDRLPPLERYLTEGFYYTNADLRTPQKSIDAYRQALEIAPGDPTAINNLGLVLNAVGQFAAAESLLRSGMAARPSMSIADNLVDALSLQSKWSALDTVFRQADAASAPDHPGRFVIRLTAVFAHRDYVRADSLVSAHEARRGGALPIPPVYWDRIGLDMVRGKYAHATRLAREVAESTLASGERLDAASAATVPAELWLELGRTADGRRELAAALAGPAFRDLADAYTPSLRLGREHALLGDVAAVRRDLRAFEARQPRMSWRPGDSARWVGLEAQAEHRWREAAAAYATSSNLTLMCSPCGAFYSAQMWEAAGEPDSAIAYYRRGTDRPTIAYDDEDALLYPLALRRLGDLYEQKGDRKAAVDWYGRFVDLWHDADPDLQPIVRDIRDRLSRLTAEPRAP